MKLEKINFLGMENSLRLTAGNMELIVLTDIGPRIISCRIPGRENMFQVYEDQLKKYDAGVWNIFGGTRLWHSPEAFPRTYYPDNEKVPYTFDGETLILDCPQEKTTGIKKEIRISISPDGEAAIEYRLTNCNMWHVEMAAWALSVMAPGGTLYVPQEKFVPAGTGEGETLVPSRPTVLWPYTDMGDARFTWGTKWIQMRQEAVDKPLKFGTNNREGFVVLENFGCYFVKSYESIDDAVYPDFGCNSEFYTNASMTEVESLSPLVRVAPQGSIRHCEHWRLLAVRPAFLD